jgi:hypothetical protein
MVDHVVEVATLGRRERIDASPHLVGRRSPKCRRRRVAHHVDERVDHPMAHHSHRLRVECQGALGRGVRVDGLSHLGVSP